MIIIAILINILAVVVTIARIRGIKKRSLERRRLVTKLYLGDAKTGLETNLILLGRCKSYAIEAEEYERARQFESISRMAKGLLKEVEKDIKESEKV